MRFLSIFVIALLSMLFDTALSAGCFSDKPNEPCLSKERTKSAIRTYCGNNWKDSVQTWREWKGVDNRGAKGNLGHIGAFRSRKECISLGNSIVDTCHGSSKGGAAERGGATFNVHFCPFRK